MSAYLFLWNPKWDTDSFSNFKEVIRDAQKGIPYEVNWICRSTRPQPGDVAFMQRTGAKNNGIFARGVVTHSASDDWDDGIRRLGLELRQFLPLDLEIPRDEIVNKAQYTEKWSPMASGNVLPEPILDAILSLWDRRSLPRGKSEPANPGTDTLETEADVFPEGRVIFRQHRLRERNRAVIDKAKAEEMRRSGGKLRCCVCRFDFADVYGALGQGFIEGHHTKPLGDLEDESETKVADIALVCSNCHRMLHRYRPWPNASELRSILRAR
jgi:hypothetical protein